MVPQRPSVAGKTGAAALAATLALVSVAVVVGESPAQRGKVVALTVAAALFAAVIVWHRWVLRWEVMTAGLLLVVLFIPIRRYAVLPGLPIDAEPYRLLLALLVSAWISALLVDPAVRLRRSGLEGPLALIGIGVVLSLIANQGRLTTDAVSAESTKAVFQLLGSVLLLYLVVSVARSQRAIDYVLGTLVGGGAVLGILAVIESRTGFNPFDQIDAVVSFFEPTFLQDIEGRGDQRRAFGSAEHPIALGALFVLLLPVAVYLAHGLRRSWWWVAVPALTLGVFATLSRTTILMAVAATLVFLWLRPRDTRRLWPLLPIALVAVHFSLPGYLSSTYASFFPQGGLISEQSSSEGSRHSAGRIADLGPAFEELSQKPLLGQGYGTRIVTGEQANAAILDNQWLETTLEVGALGIVGFAWLFIRFIRRAGAASQRDSSSRGWLLVALAASAASFAAGMLTYDAFSFAQVTLICFVLLGAGCATLGEDSSRPDPPD